MTTSPISVVSREIARNTHSRITKAVKNIHVGIFVGYVIWDCLKHWGYEARKNIMDLRQEQREEPVISIAKDGEKSNEIIEVIPRTRLEWVGVWWKKGQNICQRTGDIEEFLNLEKN
jgi:hypothetical protein